MLFFLVTLVLLRVATGTLAPKQLRFPPIVKIIGGLAFGLLTGILTVGFVLVAFETAPVHKHVFTTVAYDTKPPFGLGFDRSSWASSRSPAAGRSPVTATSPTPRAPTATPASSTPRASG